MIPTPNQIQELKEQIKGQGTIQGLYQYLPPYQQQHPCPSCGRCPTCGRGGYNPYPYLPYYQSQTGNTQGQYQQPISIN